MAANTRTRKTTAAKKKAAATTTAPMVLPGILGKIAAFVDKYVQLHSDNERIAVALWVLHTWCFSPEMPHPDTTPYLYIHSAEKRSGKTRLLETTETIIRNPMRASSVTPAVLFRTIEVHHSTVQIDEVDTIWSGQKNEDLRGVLNLGYKRGGMVPRVERGEVRHFNVFGPKALAGIDNGMLPDTVRDRCLPIHMHRQEVGASAPFYSFDVEPEAEALVKEIAAWVGTTWPKIAMQERPRPIDGISDRAWEIALPLVQLASAFTGFQQTARKALKTLLTQEQNTSPEARMLACIRDLFNSDDYKDEPTLPTAIILDALNDEDSGVAGDWNGKLLANKLQPYGVRGGSIRFHNKVERGYKRSAFADAWQRYTD